MCGGEVTQTCRIRSSATSTKGNYGMTAFGQAMMDSIWTPPPRTFHMRRMGGPSIPMSCADFLRLRQDERQLLDRVVLEDRSRVLDYGCGAGRCLAHIRDRFPRVACYGIEICNLLLDHCRAAITQPARFVSSWNDVADLSFDLIILLGNGLGVFGTETDARTMLGEMTRSLRKGGQMIIETGNPFGRGYCSHEFVIEYGNLSDGPFTWGFADREWVQQVCDGLGLVADFFPSCAPGGLFFFAVLQKRVS